MEKRPAQTGTSNSVCASAEHCVALMDYTAIQSDELTLKKNDLIKVTNKDGPAGYWEGYVEPSVGDKKATAWFPAAFVTSHPHAVLSRYGVTPCAEYVENRAVCLETCLVTCDGQEDVCERGDVVKLLKPINKESGFWLARHQKDEHTPGGKSANNRVFSFPVSKLSCNVVVTIQDYDPAGASVSQPSASASCQLAFHAGETLLVHRRWSDGWWEGTIVSREGPTGDRRGVFPSHFTVPNVCTTTPPLFCNECKAILNPSPGAAAAKNDAAADGLACRRCRDNDFVIEQMICALKDNTGKWNEAGGPPFNLFKYLSIEPRAATSQSYESSSRIVA